MYVRTSVCSFFSWLAFCSLSAASHGSATRAGLSRRSRLCSSTCSVSWNRGREQLVNITARGEPQRASAAAFLSEESCLLLSSLLCTFVINLLIFSFFRPSPDRSFGQQDESRQARNSPRYTAAVPCGCGGDNVRLRQSNSCFTDVCSSR